jgi:hypothetical protein
MYILCGTIIEHGLQHKIEAFFDEIQRSNMSKLDELGNPIYREDGKVMKGPNYFKPDFLIGLITNLVGFILGFYVLIKACIHILKKFFEKAISKSGNRFI